MNQLTIDTAHLDNRMKVPPVSNVSSMHLAKYIKALFSTKVRPYNPAPMNTSIENLNKVNNEPIVMGSDPLNVDRDIVKPLSDHVLAKVIEGRTKRTQILDGSMLPQHQGLEPYAYTHVKMTFDNEEDLIRCARILQWSDERMRSRDSPRIMWKWEDSDRDKMTVRFKVAWFSKEFFDENKKAFRDDHHQSYFQLFGLSVADIKTRHEILKASK